MKKRTKRKIDEKKKEIQKQRAGIDQETIEEWHEIDRRNERASLRYKLKQLFPFLKKHKLGSIITFVASILTIIMFISVFLPSLLTPHPETYFKDVNFNRIEDQDYETFDITIGNKGTASSKNVVLEASFSNRITVNRIKSSWSRDPDNITTDSKYMPHFIKLTWDNVPATIEITISLHLDFSVGGPPEAGKVVPPLYIKIFAVGEHNPIYDFKRDTLQDIMYKI